MHPPLAVPLPVPASGHEGLTVRWARHLDDVRAAQRLRHDVAGPDADLFDDHCEHILVCDGDGEVIGTCRLLAPAQARRIGSTHSDTAFDLTRLRRVRERMVELGRICVHPEHRHRGVLLAQWRALSGFMAANGLDVVIGCASIPMHADGRVAASVWRQMKASHLAPIDWHVRPRLPLPVERLDDSLAVNPPALISSCLRLGARVMGPPAWNPDFNTADLPMVLRLRAMAP